MPKTKAAEKKVEKQPSKIEVWLTKHLSGVPVMQKILFVHNLSIMVKAGLSIVDGLRILSEQVENKRLKNVIAEVKGEVEKGKQLSEALVEHPEVFPPIYVSMIGAGETAGKMEEALTQVSTQMKKSHALASSIRGALIYPAVVLFAMGGIGVFMMVFVIPKILVMFTDMNVELPFSTKILIFVVNGLQHYGIFVVIAVVAFVVVWLRMLKTLPKFKAVIHESVLHLPIFGKVIKQINIARFTLTLSSLLQSSIPIIDAVKITSSVEGNVKYRDDLLASAEALKKGEPLSSALQRSPSRFPPMVVQMISVGEESGEVENMLKELATYYSDEVDNTMKNFSTIIEPVLILLLGLGVGFIAVSVIMPMYSLSQSV